MTPCFADTFFFLALLNARDAAYHPRAREANLVNRSVVTSYWVMLELADHLCDERNRLLFGEVLEAIENDARYTVLSVNQEVLDKAVTLYRSRRDKAWSLTDCTSFILMENDGLTEALTADHHLEQAGFVALLK